MDYLGMLLQVAVAAKLKAIVSAIIWIAKRGEEHAVELKGARHARELSESDFFTSFRRHGGDFWPFGVKDYKLRSMIRRLSHHPRPSVRPVVLWASRCAAFVLNVSRLTLFQYAFLSFLCAAFVMAAAIANCFSEVLSFVDPQNLRHIAFAVVVGTILMNLVMAVEFVFGHLFLTDYALYFHMLSPLKTVLAGRSQVAVGMQIAFRWKRLRSSSSCSRCFGPYVPMRSRHRSPNPRAAADAVDRRRLPTPSCPARLILFRYRANEAWRILPGESPGRVRANHPPPYRVCCA